MILLVIVLLVLLIPVLAIVLDSQLGRALATRIEGAPTAMRDATLEARIKELEAEVERLSSEVLRLDDEGRFMTRLLAERGSAEHDEASEGHGPRRSVRGDTEGG